ncbi:hypothetical protein [Phosphitispora fastidiosa]|uniref:hypothetical protein n=1 Tax=Phosphitispora fastidiosa TaxID=2837202 RepID=UPI001E31B804|nr:hypothetical protein [Phosphitispora fastidiosa]MBU7006334.1 hypothetical protein [Phosphitispora fastidiosa]
MSDRYSRLLEKKKAGIKTGENSVTSNVTEEKNTIDPRSDLKNDHLFWENMLINSKQLFPETPNVFSTLHGIRCSGAGLAQNKTGGLKLLPGENTPEEWQDTKTRWLDPIREQLIKLLQVSAMGRVEGELPRGVFAEQTSLRDAWTKGR